MSTRILSQNFGHLDELCPVIVYNSFVMRKPSTETALYGKILRVTGDINTQCAVQF